MSVLSFAQFVGCRSPKRGGGGLSRNSSLFAACVAVAFFAAVLVIASPPAGADQGGTPEEPITDREPYEPEIKIGVPYHSICRPGYKLDIIDVDVADEDGIYGRLACVWVDTAPQNSPTPQTTPEKAPGSEPQQAPGAEPQSQPQLEIRQPEPQEQVPEAPEEEPPAQPQTMVSGQGDPPTRLVATRGERCHTGNTRTHSFYTNSDVYEIYCAKVDLADAKASAETRRRELGINARNGQPMFSLLAFVVYVILDDGTRIHTDTIQGNRLLGNTMTGINFIHRPGSGAIEWVTVGKTYTFEIGAQFMCDNARRNARSGRNSDCSSDTGDSGRIHWHRERVTLVAAA